MHKLNNGTIMKKLAVCLIIIYLANLFAADKTHGLAIYGPQDLKYKENEPYEHANVNAPKGGTVYLSAQGTFTTHVLK